MDTREWYESLIKPSWASAPDVFGRVWSVIYPIIFAVNIAVALLLYNGKINWLIALPFWINLFFNFAYTPIQFGLKNQFLSSIAILLVFITIIWCMVAIYQMDHYCLYSIFNLGWYRKCFANQSLVAKPLKMLLWITRWRYH